MKILLSSLLIFSSILSFGQTKIHYNLQCDITIPEFGEFYKVIEIDTSTNSFRGKGMDYDQNGNLLREFFYDSNGGLDSLVMYEEGSFLLAAIAKGSELKPLRLNEELISKKEARKSMDLLEYCIKRQESFSLSNFVRQRDYPELRKYLAPQTRYDSTAVFTVVEEASYFRGGIPALGQFIEAFLRYPNEALENNITGVVKVKFTIETNGVPTDFEVVQGIGYGCDEEALRVMRLMPDWVPGYQRGKAVVTTKLIPIEFN